MDLYLKLQQDKAKGRLTDEQFEEALGSISFKKKKQTRPPKQSADERARRKGLRNIVKWFFDVELFSSSTPLYLDSTEQSLVLKEFLKLSDKVIRYAGHNTDTADSTRNELVNSIKDIVQNRHKNIRASKKPGNKLRPMKAIYCIKKELMVTGKNGEKIILQQPSPLPLPDPAQRVTPALSPATAQRVTPAPSPATAQRVTPAPSPAPAQRVTPAPSPAPAQRVTPAPSPAPAQLVTPAPSPATPQRVTPAPSPVLPRTSADLSSSDDDNEFDILQLQEEIMQLQARIAQRKRNLKQEKAKSVKKTTQVAHNVSTGSWLQTMSQQTAAKTITCRNADCGRDFVVDSTVGNQNGAPVLCATCWDSAKEELQAITSPTGSKKTQKKVTTTKQQVKKATKKRKRKQCPGTPERENKLTRTLTPPNPKINKFKVINMYYPHLKPVFFNTTYLFRCLSHPTPTHPRL